MLWHVMEIHYDNPRLQKDIVDLRGVHSACAQETRDQHSAAWITNRQAYVGWCWIGKINQHSTENANLSFAIGVLVPPAARRRSQCLWQTTSKISWEESWDYPERESKYKHDIDDTAYDFDLQIKESKSTCRFTETRS